MLLPRLTFSSALVLAAFGCGSGRYANSPMPSELAPSSSAATGAPAAGGAVEGPENAGEPTLTLVAAGAEPRAPLRYHPAAGVSQDATVTLQMGMGQGGRSQTSVILLGAKRTVGEVLAGVVHRTFRLTKVDLGPEAEAGGARELLKGIDAMGARETVTDRGFVREIVLEAPADATPLAKNTAEEILQAIDDTAAVFPRAPIGVGARWDVTAAMTKRGMKMQRITHYTLVAHDGDRCTIGLAISFTAPPQQMPLEGLPPGNSAELSALTSEGAGESRFDLTKPFPLESNVKTSTTMELAITQQGQKQPVTMKLDVAVKLAAN